MVEDPIKESLPTTVKRLVAAAGGDSSSPYSRVDVPGIASGYPLREVPQLHAQLRAWQRPILHAALMEIAQGTTGAPAADGHPAIPSDPTTAESMLALLCRGAQQCHARKVAVFMTVLECASNMRQDRMKMKSGAPSSGSGGPVVGRGSAGGTAGAGAGAGASAGAGAAKGEEGGDMKAVTRARTTVVDFLLGKMDEWKEKAMAATFSEPSKAYYRAARDGE